MAKQSRDDQIGLEWLAWYAMQLGDEPPERLVEYLEQVEPKLGAFIAAQRDKLSADDEQMLSGLHLVLIGMRLAAGKKAGFEMKLVLSRRRPGKPIDRHARANAGHAAAYIVESQVAQGMKQEAAIADATAKTGLSRAEIFTWLKMRRNWRDPKWRAAQLSKLSAQKGE